jgi:hypothetical protein
MSPKLALVCDDRAERLRTWAAVFERRLGNDWTVRQITEMELVDLVDALSEAERPYREADRGDSAAMLSPAQTDLLRLVGSAELLVLDSDLTPSRTDMEPLGEQGTTITRALRNQSGETLARQARALTGVGYVTVVNRYHGVRFFDLTMNLFVNGFADLYITNDDIDSDALWTGAPAGGRYNPSYWPVLNERLDALVQAEAFVHDLDSDLFSKLGLNPEALEPEQLDVLAHVEDPHTATFRDLVDSPLGLRFTLVDVPETVARRVAASVLLRWLVRTICAPQNVVSDLPHLLTRFPRLFGDDASQRSFWEAAAVKGEQSPVDIAVISSALSPISTLVGRPFFDLELIRKLGPHMQSAGTTPLRLVFAEDTSRFLDAAQTDDFASGLPGPSFRRYVESLDRRGESDDDREVEYLPKVRRR